MGSKPNLMARLWAPSPRRRTTSVTPRATSAMDSPEFEVERDPGIEIDAVEYGRDRGHAAERKAARSGRTFKYQRQPVRTVLQVVQRLGIRG